ncbi:MAG: hypothetical protein JW798_02190 [Prolixibacteraceae bacterium]|nr:hypothetical protein [Prolixibacteraceae bacterium]
MPTRFKYFQLAFVLVFECLIAFPKHCDAQTAPVNVSVNVMPPYTSALSDYIDTPNKLLISLTHNQPAIGPLEVYLSFSITGDAGLSVSSEPGYKPGTSIYLQPGTIKVLTLDELGAMFDMGRLITNGINLTDVLSGAGLPEDNYQVCVRVFDYLTDQPLSEENPMGCSNIFFITNLEPPIITNPICGEPVIAQPFQNIIINWTIPPGAFGIEYLFQLIEIPPEVDLDPNEAFDVSGFAPVYEETLFANMLLLTSDKVSLIPGYVYAFRVQSVDPTGRYHFRNNGFSEVCTFSYLEGSGLGMPDIIENIRVTIPSVCNPDSQLTVTNLRDFYINWKIDRTVVDQSKASEKNIDFVTLQELHPGKKFYVRFFDSKKLKNEIYSESTTNFHIQFNSSKANSIFSNNTPYWFTVELLDSLTGEVVIPVERCSFRYRFFEEVSEYELKTITGKILYNFENNPAAGTFPVRNSSVTLVCNTLLISEDDTTVLSSEQLSATNLPDKKLKKTSLSIAGINEPGQVTDDEGRFSITFNWLKNAGLGMISSNYQTEKDGLPLTGTLWREIKLKIDNPYYADPDFILSLWDGSQSFDLGEITTNVKSYILKALIEEGYGSSEGLKKPLTGKRIYVVRKNPHNSLPGYEGNLTPPGSLQQSIPTLSQNGYHVVSSATTTADKDEDGNDVSTATFHNLIQNLVQGDHYYLWIEGTPIETIESFSYKKPSNNLLMSVGITGSTTTSVMTNLLTTPADYTEHDLIGYDDIRENSLTVNARFVKITDSPPLSGIKGRLVYHFPGEEGTTRALANTNISIISCWVTTEGIPSKIAKKSGYYANDPNAFEASVLFTSKTNANGEFEFSFPNIPPGNSTTSGHFETSTGELNRRFGKWETWESDPDPSFRILYTEDYGLLKRVFRIVVEDPNGLYMSPDDNIEVEPLKTIDVGTLTSNVFSYKLKGATKLKIPSEGIGLSTFIPIQGVECYVLRESSAAEAMNLPEGEGKNIMGSLDEFPGYTIVTKEISDSKGEFVFENLLFRNANVPILQYFRTPDMAGDANYEPELITQNTINTFAKPVYFFNSDYNYSEITDPDATLEPRTPTVKGKVVSNINISQGVQGARCELEIKYKNHSSTFRFIYTPDTSGYFDFKNVFEDVTEWGWLPDISEVRLKVSKTGYHYIENNNSKPYYQRIIPAEFITMGQQFVEPKITLYASGNLTGFVVNEQNKPVDSYVQFLPSGTNQGAGQMVKTSSVLKGGFSIPALPGNHKLAVIPVDAAYFADTIAVNVSTGSSTYLDTITVYERSHRIQLSVKYKMPGNVITLPVKDARVQLLGEGDYPVVLSDANGIARLNFRNVSVNNLMLKVSGPTGSTLIPKIVTFQNEESKTVQVLPTVILQNGIMLTGKVLLDGEPTADAEISVDLRKGIDTQYSVADDGTSTTESQYFFTARPKTDGTFNLLLPPEVKGKQVEVNAVYKPSLIAGHLGKGKTSEPSATTNTTVVGETKFVNIPAVNETVFNLTTFDEMTISDVWGFPLNITSLTQNSDGSATVSGKVKLNGYSKGFDMINDATFEIFAVKFVSSGKKENGKPVGEPQNNEVIVYSNRSLKLNYAQSYNVLLKTKPGKGLFCIEKNNQQSGKGFLGGLAHIVDNSFQYPGSYLSFDENKPFYLAKKVTTQIGGQGVNMVWPVINVFNSGEAGNSNTTVPFNLCNISNTDAPVAEDLRFRFVGFNAVSKAASSIIEGDMITLDTRLNASVKNAGNIEVHIGNMVLRNKTIDPVSGETPIVIKLNDEGIYDASLQWTLEARNWIVDPKQGGIFSTNCVVHTHKLDIPIGSFNLRSDFAYMGDPKYDQITLGDYPIQFHPAAKSSFGYNTATGSDKKGHWELVIYPPPGGAPPATVHNLPNMTGILQLETVSLLSNGEDVFTISPGAAGMRLYNVVDFHPISLFTLPDGFVLKGNINFHIPRIKDEIGARLTFAKSGGSNYSLTFKPIDIGFDGKGNIKFEPILTEDETSQFKQRFNALNRTFTSYGAISEPGKLEPVFVKLTYNDRDNIGSVTTSVVQSDKHTGQTIKIGSSTTYLNNIACSMFADQTDWNNFRFEGDMQGFKGIAADANKRMKFEVFGEIKANHNGFKADQINTAFGTLKITYEKDMLLGTVEMDHIPLGSTIVTGVANLLMDKDGWIFYSTCKADNVPAPEPTTINTGILIGNYPSTVNDQIKNTVLTYAVNKELPETFKRDNLKGFYMVGGRNLPLAGLDVSVNLVLASAHVSVPTSAVDAAFWGNFSNGANFGYAVTGGFEVKFGIGAITCTSLSGYVFNKVGLEGGWDSVNGAALNGFMEMTGNLSIEQGVPFVNGCNDAVSKQIGVTGGFKLGVPFDFWYDLDF